MKPFDIEAYLAGDLPPDERTRIEAEMAQNPAFRAEVEQLRDLAMHLREQRVRERVVKALLEKPAPESPRISRRWRFLLAGLFVCMLAGAWWQYRKVFNPSPENLPVKTDPPPSVQEDTIPDLKQLEKPIAQHEAKNKHSQTPDFTGGNMFVRGGNDTLSPELQKLLEATWFSDFDTTKNHYSPRFQSITTYLDQRDFATAFLALHVLEKETPDNDTLLYLKGYCLLEMHEGAEAARYLTRLDVPGKPWQAEALWYGGLAYLLNGEQPNAKSRWQKLLALPRSTFTKQAEKGLKLLK